MTFWTKGPSDVASFHHLHQVSNNLDSRTNTQTDIQMDYLSDTFLLNNNKKQSPYYIKNTEGQRSCVFNSAVQLDKLSSSAEKLLI